LNETGLLLSQLKIPSIWRDQLYLNSSSKPESGNVDDEHENKKVVNEEVENAARLSTVSLETQSGPLQTAFVG